MRGLRNHSGVLWLGLLGVYVRRASKAFAIVFSVGCIVGNLGPTVTGFVVVAIDDLAGVQLGKLTGSTVYG